MAKHKKPEKLREYTCQGRLVLEGVTFFIKAHSQEDAEEKAGNGEFDSWEIHGAEGVDWTLDYLSVEPN